MRTIALFVFLLALASAKTFKVFQLTDIHIEESMAPRSSTTL